jgi:hypothetical protein
LPSLIVIIEPATGISITGTGDIFVDAVYRRIVLSESATETETGNPPITIQDNVRTNLDTKLNGKLELIDLVPNTDITAQFSGPNGLVRLQKTLSSSSSPGTILITQPRTIITLSRREVELIVTPDPMPAPSITQIHRRAYFVPVGEPLLFEGFKLQISPLRVGGNGWMSLGLNDIFLTDTAVTSSVQWTGPLPPSLRTSSWMPCRLSIDGQFSFSVPEDSGDAWMWWLTGPVMAIGIVLDNLSDARVIRMPVSLPAITHVQPPSDVPKHVPPDVTETEVVTNPDIYSEDPGEFCRPFRNPERVLGEQRFFALLRPVISAEASLNKEPMPIVTYNPKTPEVIGTNPGLSRIRTIPGVIYDGDNKADVVSRSLPSAYLEIIRRYDRCRTVLDAVNPIQWEGDISRYQATTVARGHILEFRMRWRSYGYSLGSVAKTLTLAPRQVTRYGLAFLNGPGESPSLPWLLAR